MKTINSFSEKPLWAKCTLCFLIFVLLYLSVIPFRGQYLSFAGIDGFVISNLAAMALYFIVALQLLRNFSSNTHIPLLVISMIAGSVIIEIPFMAFAGSDGVAKSFFLTEILFWCCSILSAWWYSRLRGPIKTVFLTIYIMLSFWIGFALCSSKCFLQ